MGIIAKAKRIAAGLISLSVLAAGLPAGMVSGAEGAAYLEPYAKAPYEETCDVFTLTVDGKPVDVVKYFDSRYSYAHLAYEGTATFQVTLQSGEAITDYDISPHSYNLNDAAVAEGDTLTFALTQSEARYLVIEIHTASGQLRNLAIAADPQDTEAAPVPDGEKVVDITKAPYNADNTGGTNVTEILQKAVDDMGAKGGGTVYVPEGVYQFTYIDFLENNSNVTLYLDAGAVLRGSSNRDDYEWNGSGSGNIQGRRNILFQGGVKNVAIKGRGMIDANSTVLVEPKPGQKPTGWDDYRKGIFDAFSENGQQPDGITLEGITVKDATGWTFNLNDSKNITITHLKMLNDDDFVHSDGYDICACENVLVDWCFGYTGDDVFCAKGSSADYPLKNVTFRNGVAYASGGAGCKIGVQSRSDASNILFENIDVIQGYRGFSVSHDEGPAVWEDIRFIDIRTEKLHVANPSDTGQYRAAPFVIWTLQRDGEIGTVSGVEVTRCTIEDTAGLKGIIRGETANGKPGTISNIDVTDLVMDGQSITHDNYLRKVSVGANVENLTFANTEIIEPAYTVYEAETAVFTDGASAVEADTCSAGWKVGSLGGDTNGACTFREVYANMAGRYTMMVYYNTYVQRSFYVTVNDQEPVELVCEGNGVDWTTLSAVPMTVRLEKGVNTIRFDNPTGAFAPDLDKIEIDNVSLDPPAVPGVVYLSDLEWVSATSGWEGHDPQRDVSIDGNPLRIRMAANDTREFAKGIGTHAVSEIVIDVSGLACERFQCYVAPDVEATASGRTSVTFTVYADDAVKFTSGTMGRDSDAQYVDVDITGAKTLRLVAGDSDDGVNNDHADWADAKIITTTTAQEIADALEAPVIAAGQTELPLPAVPEGYSVELTGSDSKTIGLDGTITPPVEDERVLLTYTVTKDGTSEAGTATLMVTVPGTGVEKPVIEKVTVTPPAANVLLGGSLQLQAAVEGTGDFDEGVNWSVTGQNAVDTAIGQDGKLTIAADETARKITVTAVSREDAQVSGSAEISLYLQGDMDEDGEISIKDVMSLCKVLARNGAGQEPTDLEILIGSMDGNERVDITDVMALCRVLARHN